MITVVVLLVDLFTSAYKMDNHIISLYNLFHGQPSLLAGRRRDPQATRQNPIEKKLQPLTT